MNGGLTGLQVSKNSDFCLQRKIAHISLLLSFLLGWNNSYTNYVCICFSVSATGELHKLQSGSNPKWSEMTKHLRRDDTNPSEDLRGYQPSDNIQNYQILP